MKRQKICRGIDNPFRRIVGRSFESELREDGCLSCFFWTNALDSADGPRMLSQQSENLGQPSRSGTEHERATVCDNCDGRAVPRRILFFPFE